MEARVCLLSDLARSCLEKPAERQAPRGFWSSLSTLFGKERGDVEARPCPFDNPFEKQLLDEGYIPFCKIGDIRFLVKEEGPHRYLAIMENGQTWDLSEWGSGTIFRSRLVAETYFMVTKDDFRIDEQEAEVLRAIFAFFQVTSEEIAAAKELVYWTLVENTMEDGVITDEEQETMARITAALELSDEDRLELHRRAIDQRFNELFSRPAGAPPPTEADIATICEMARRFGLEEEFIAFKAEGARARLAQS
jgi:hypothetical protein